MRLDLTKRPHALAAGALLEVLLLGAVALCAPMLVGAHSVLLLELLVLIVQFPTSLLAIAAFHVMPAGLALTAQFAICAAILFIGQTVFFTWWLGFKARKATWDPSAG